ncbi:MAG: SMP-30/gluconolactonase/LRE family protein [Acidimicrobiales bacterium]|jgi:sugar lactone lactonase YvrE
MTGELAVARSISAELAFAGEAELGEGPVWDPVTKTLIWLDLLGEKVHRSDPSSGLTTTVAVERTVGAVALRAAGGLVAAVAGGFAGINDLGQLDTLVHLETDMPHNRMNDGKCAPDGSFWAGTMDRDGSPGAGTLYRLGPDLQVSVLLTGLTVSNGLGWAPDGTAIYFIDTPDARIDKLNQSGPDTWTRTPWVSIDPSLGSPDGLTVDAEGNVWVAMCFGGRVLCYSPAGELRATVEVPAKVTTSVAFGGDELDLLFITTGRTTLSETEKLSQPTAGSVFVAVTSTVGLPPAVFGG